MSQQSLDKFGKFIIENLYDKGIYKFMELKKGNFKLHPNQTENPFDQFDESQIKVIEAILRKTLTGATHDFLFALEERNDLEEDIQVMVDQENIAELSDGLQGELFLEDGWINKFSEY